MPSIDGHTQLAVRRSVAAKMLDISESTLFRLSHPRGPIPTIRDGDGRKKIVRYDVDDLRAWIKVAKGGVA